MIYLPDEQATIDFAERLAKNCQPPLFVAFSGHLGAGKTTLIRAFLQAKGIQERIKSPSFALLETYQQDALHYYHFDFYRLDDPEELLLIGVEDYFTADSICLVEWPEKAAELLPTPDLQIQLQIVDSGRQLDIIPGSEKGDKILAFLAKDD